MAVNKKDKFTHKVGDVTITEYLHSIEIEGCITNDYIRRVAKILLRIADREGFE